MGMAASQARLLTLTARLHDVEYQAQSIQNAKVQLSTQSDRISEEYLEALDAQTLTLTAIDPTSGAKSIVPATFNNLFGRDRLTPANGANLVLLNKAGSMVVDDKLADAFMEFTNARNNDPYEFAIYMIAGPESVHDLGEGFTQAVNNAEEKVYASHCDENESLKKLHESLEKLTNNYGIYAEDHVDKENLDEYKDTLAAYKNLLYKTNGGEVLKEATQDSDFLEKFSFDNMNYYITMFQQMKAAGSVVRISDYNGSLNGDASNNSDWLKAMIECGEMSIQSVTTDKNGKLTFNGVSPSSDSSISFTTTTTIDNRALAKAEAKYEKDMRDIERKDKRYDMSLSKLETERTAITTEIDSVKKVIEDNIDRTFGIFS